MPQENIVAGLVLGSNSFHLLVSRLENSKLMREAHEQEAVQLAAGVDANGEIEAAYLERARACLDRFAARLSDFEPARAAAVATGVLRTAHNAGDLVRGAANTLGVPVHLLSGREEAFLNYVGLSVTYGLIDDNRLVVDIGGGSTEFVIGHGRTVTHLESVDLGCIPITRRFFAGGISDEAFQAAEAEAGETLRPVADSLLASGWSETVGTGGTIMTAGGIMQLRRLGGRFMTRKGIDRLKAAMMEQRLEALAEGIATRDRVAILPGGVAIISAMLDVFGVERMGMSPGALREGVLVCAARGNPPGRSVVQPGS